MKKKRKIIDKWRLIILALIFSAALNGYSQDLSDDKSEGIVENVKYSVADGMVTVSYDLLGSADQTYKVSLILRRTSSNDLVYYPKSVSGDIGEGQSGGKDKKIIWNMKQDFPGGLSGSDFYFVVKAESVESGPNILLWTGLGVAAAAAVVTYLIVGGENSNANNQGGSFPMPPGRP